MTTQFEARRIIVLHMLGQAIEAVNPTNLVKGQIALSSERPKIAAIPIGAMSCAPLEGMPPVNFGSRIIHPQEVGRLVVVGTGKASAAMAAGIEVALQGLGESGELLLSKLCGIVNVPDGIVAITNKIKIRNVRPQGSNTPTDRVLAATKEQVKLLNSLRRSDVLIDLISGGGSATRELLCGKLTLADLEAVRLALSSATIQELNAVRKCCSLVKGGKLNPMASWAGSVNAWILSDVVGDPLDFIASGPWAENTTRPTDALGILRKYGVASGAVFDHISALAKKRWNAIKPNKNVQQIVIGNNAVALDALEAAFTSAQYPVLKHGTNITGDARNVGTGLVMLNNISTPIEICGGETTVTFKPGIASRKGGRNQTIVLAALAAAWNGGLGDRIIFSVGTDGEDGPTDAAGAIIDQELLERARCMGITLQDVVTALDDSNEYPLLERMGALIKTGPTGTNVCDIWGVCRFSQS